MLTLLGDSPFVTCVKPLPSVSSSPLRRPTERVVRPPRPLRRVCHFMSTVLPLTFSHQEEVNRFYLNSFIFRHFIAFHVMHSGLLCFCHMPFPQCDVTPEQSRYPAVMLRRSETCKSSMKKGVRCEGERGAADCSIVVGHDLSP